MSELLKDDNQDPVIDPSKDYLSELVGDGKKFKDAADLAKGKWYADQTIEVMKKRMDEMRSDFLREREQNLTRAQLEEVMTRFAQTPLASSEKPTANEDEKKPVFDPSQIESLVTNKYSELRAKEQQDANFKMVKEKMMARYGENYKTAVSQQINEIGLTGDEVDQMARTKPQMLIKALGLDQTKSTETFQPPMRNTFNFQPTAGKDRTWTFYQELKAKDRDAYYSQKVQNQMVDDYARLGQAFEDGNFHQYN
jgi:hypothetical protein